MKCPKCHSDGCQIISETQTKGKDYSVGKGCCGAMVFQSWFGLICGFCGEGKKTTTGSAITAVISLRRKARGVWI